MFNSNPIEINKSSLVSLKAEILRKQQELNGVRPKERPRFHKSITKLTKKNVETNNEAIIIEKEDNNEEILSHSKKMLETKAQLYNNLSKGNLSERDLEISKRCLVQFDKKSPSHKPPISDDESVEEYHSDDYDAPNPEEEWVEYVDSLGRTRKCLKKDLDYMKRKDRELGISVSEKKSNKEEIKKFVKEKDEDKIEGTEKRKEITEENDMLSSDMRRELLRKEWDKQEEEIMNKKNVHYQDILFSEARSHGVGYYAFSKEEEERSKQQENLKKLREDTTQQQKVTSDLRALREDQMAKRLKAARNRKRARMGLPPEEDEPNVSNTEVKHEDDLEKQNQAEKEVEELRKQEERSKIIRPWDIGKEILKKHYEYSQEDWVEKQRNQRNKEFAPPSIYNNSKKPSHEENSSYFSSKRYHEDSSSSSHEDQDIRKYKSRQDNDEENISSYRSSKRSFAESTSKTHEDQDMRKYKPRGDNQEESISSCFSSKRHYGEPTSSSQEDQDMRKYNHEDKYEESKSSYFSSKKYYGKSTSSSHEDKDMRKYNPKEDNHEAKISSCFSSKRYHEKPTSSSHEDQDMRSYNPRENNEENKSSYLSSKRYHGERSSDYHEDQDMRQYNQVDLEESVLAGLKFLRKQSEQRHEFENDFL